MATPGYPETACNWASTDSNPFGACSMSMSTQSSPAPAMISAATGEPVVTHPP